MKLLRIITLGLSISAILFLSGCAGTKNIIVKTPEASVMNDKDKAYVVFTTRKLPLVNRQAKIMEFEPTTFKPTFLGTFDGMQKYIHKVDPGKHCYLIDPEMDNHVITSKRIVAIDAKPGEVCNVDSLGATIVPDSRKELTDKIKNSTCSSDGLKRYGFFARVGFELESDLLSYEIKCDGTKVAEVTDKRLLSFDDIQKATLVDASKEDLQEFYAEPKLESAASPYAQEKKKKSEAKNYQDEIAELYPTMVDVHKNVFQLCAHRKFAFRMYSIDIIQSTKDDSASKYQAIKLSSSNDIGNTEQKYIDDFNSEITKNVNENKIQSSDDIAIKYQINNYIHGNQALRYFGLTESQRLSGMSSLIINVKFIDIKSNNTIGEINYVAIMYGGALGGTIGLLSDAATDIVEYAKMNYLK